MPWGVAATAIIGGAIQSDSSRRAANTQKDAANAANQLSQDQYNQTVARNQPFMQAGQTGLNALLDRLGISGNTGATGYGQFGHMPTAEEVMGSPGYQFGLDQGMNVLNRQLNARGMSYSGAQGKALAQFGTNYATSKYNDAYNRLMDSNRFQQGSLNNLATLGQSAANNTSAAGTQYATQAGNNLMGAGNAQAANALAQGNIWQGAINQGVSAYQNRTPSTAGSSGSWGSTGGGSGGWGSGDAYGNQDLGQYLG